MKRCDGTLLRSISPFVKIVPYIMVRRSDAENFYKQQVCTDPIDAYLKEKQEAGENIGYLHFFIALYVRLLFERPQLNRFVMNSQLYQRKGVFVSMAVKRALKDTAEETTVKFAFTGRETVFEVARIIDKTIADNTVKSEDNGVDKTAGALMSLPGFTKKILMAFVKGLDQYNLLPKLIIDVSPFHTSLFFTYLKSIKLDYIYHHLYDFGTTGIFVALGKNKRMPVAEGDAVVAKNCCEIGYTLDERICDGLYFSNTLKLMEKYLANPTLLETGPEEPKAAEGQKPYALA